MLRGREPSISLRENEIFSGISLRIFCKYMVNERGRATL